MFMCVVSLFYSCVKAFVVVVSIIHGLFCAIIFLSFVLRFCLAQDRIVLAARALFLCFDLQLPAVVIVSFIGVSQVVHMLPLCLFRKFVLQLHVHDYAAKSFSSLLRSFNDLWKKRRQDNEFKICTLKKKTKYILI